MSGLVVLDIIWIIATGRKNYLALHKAMKLLNILLLRSTTYDNRNLLHHTFPASIPSHHATVFRRHHKPGRHRSLVLQNGDPFRTLHGLRLQITLTAVHDHFLHGVGHVSHVPPFADAVRSARKEVFAGFGADEEDASGHVSVGQVWWTSADWLIDSGVPNGYLSVEHATD